MPPRRKKPGDVPSDQWVLIAPDSLKDDAEKPSDKTLFAKLRSPLSDKGAMFLFISCGQQVCEVKVFQEEYRSWFIGQTVQEDGRLLYVTPVDPLFLVLYYLMKADKEQGKFQPVEQIVVDEEFPACSLLLQCTPVAQSLHHVTEEKEIGSKKFYKYSKEKTLAWLKKKVDQTVKVLKDSDVCVGGTTQSVSFIRVKQESHIQEEDYVRYAHGLVSEYISIQLRDELSTYLNLPEVSSPTPEPPTKANSKMSAAQKSLAKVDKSGMKNISSFFSPKSKATK
ncbi:ribonuclease H2 subunit B isoform X2 [Bufo gargarizans]|uniref:ribonuclease H2 subunit B isoform X2 n=1 Tax=Bufo gargarizans TaxID=30331 RepID=UPI001CF4CE81|nr:ribonuclease H2 subunit B isoform X2 [Bufo gargarizans]